MSNVHFTKIGGNEYRVSLLDVPDANGIARPVVWVRVARIQADGSKVWAFLSHRQQKAEARARGRFAAEIKAHLAKFQ